ncbi:2-keto-4-pentenoate hydratase/2-oxohepta-3-ene-1,7-dioic acid hydratase in catechol pathway [Variovorax boronicumulans]|uniref:2-keto-4-pentenoate hydratase/2-oxohepta-3-ene-1,7-dioic acid hydratase in catechol pathway n=1 Tax=Variovorax boronicumulans TaxID=436515 RepID=A0AAW8D3W5_9BURK|nr:fumarylacetoacetate hydrolase family protein [Variovorax boronicumulans]MDP9894919.1 2-keto-4-pentenoate hydratase/2-oxohepta-3-ene-1,7-dioic acid hydratase in catechol pathway [Variovorax boronicumulans]MDQ0054761.1 2-keto-4-pentenoate hydratase/2-oxohepta-3-ene-1,7-dioic acid hydratase in catechol pathway [Variovorax boronicumulans]
MKIYKFLQGGQPRFGVLEEPGTVRTMKTSPFEGSIEMGEETWPLSSLVLLPPTVAHPRIFGVGLNYKSHILETGRPLPEIPSIFMKPDTALIGHGQSIVYPSASTVVHYETELVAVIGRKARSVACEDALHYVLGYACGNDVSERTIQRKEMSLGLMTVGKAFDTFAPVGPCIDTSVDPSKLRMRGRLNGVVVQDCQTSDLLFGVDALVAYLSKSITLMPGDLIMTGTPGGIGPLKPGDIFEIDIEGVGVLRNDVIGDNT